LIEAHHPAADAHPESRGQRAQAPRVLGRHHVRGGEHPTEPVRCVARVPDGGGRQHDPSGRHGVHLIPGHPRGPHYALRVTSTSGVRSPGRPLPAPDTGPVETTRDLIVTGVIVLLAFVSRFWGLGSASDGGTPIFDEKHYAPQSYNIAQLGIEENPAYGLVVHPPVAKQIESIGGMLFGYTPVGWRFMAAICGVLVILMVMRITRRLTRSTQLGLIAGLLLCMDGVTFVTSRIGMLDISQVVFVTAAA